MLGSSLRRQVQILACAIATTTLGVEFILTGSIARAVDVKLLTCVGTSSGTYKPGLTDTSQQTTFTAEGSLTPCISQGDPTITSGSFKNTGNGLYSCLLNSSGPYTVTYNWNNKKASTVRYDTTVVERVEGNTVFTSTGEVSSGPYVGARAVRTSTIATSEFLNCNTPQGVTSDSGAEEVEFLGPVNLSQ